MDKVLQVIGAVVFVIIFICLFGLLLAFPVKWLWNVLMPDIFGLTTISVWQAWGLLVLCGILFRSSVETKS